MLLPDLNKGISKDSCDSNPFFFIPILPLLLPYFIKSLCVYTCACVCGQEREGNRS